MKVKDLIKDLEKLDPEMVVQVLVTNAYGQKYTEWQDVDHYHIVMGKVRLS